MAKKLRKVPRSPAVLFIELLLPWVVMAATTTLAKLADLPTYAIVACALGAALVTTYVIHLYEKRRRRRTATPADDAPRNLAR